MRRHTAAVPIALTVAAALAAPASHATTVAVEGTTLVVTAEPGQANVVLVTSTGPGRYRVADDGADVAAGPGCSTRGPRAVACAGIVTSVHAELGDGDDAFSALGLPLPVTAQAGDGNDLLQGGAAADTLDGGPGTDGLSGSAGADVLDGSAGDDTLDGDSGADTVDGGDGADIAAGGAGDDDHVDGGTGDDLLQGGPGDDDQVDGGPGDDVLSPGGGQDTLTTGSGTDQVFLPAGGTSTVRCRPGDEVRAPAAVVPDQCTQLPPTAAAPVAWARTQAPAQASYLVDVVNATPIVKGDALTVRVYVRTGLSSRRARVRFTFRDRHHHALRPLDRVLWTQRVVKINLPPHYRHVVRAKGAVR